MKTALAPISIPCQSGWKLLRLPVFAMSTRSTPINSLPKQLEIATTADICLIDQTYYNITFTAPIIALLLHQVLEDSDDNNWLQHQQSSSSRSLSNTKRRLIKRPIPNQHKRRLYKSKNLEHRASEFHNNDDEDTGEQKQRQQSLLEHYLQTLPTSFLLTPSTTQTQTPARLLFHQRQHSCLLQYNQ